jgi:hypothetical protein
MQKNIKPILASHDLKRANAAVQAGGSGVSSALATLESTLIALEQFVVQRQREKARALVAHPKAAADVLDQSALYQDSLHQDSLHVDENAASPYAQQVYTRFSGGKNTHGVPENSADYLAFLQDDRAHLAAELDQTLDRLHRLEDVTTEIDRRVTLALNEVRLVLTALQEISFVSERDFAQNPVPSAQSSRL